MSDYSIESLENGIAHCRKNIEVLEMAIEKERSTIKDYRIMIDDVEFAEKAKALAESNVTVEVVRE